MTRFLTFCFLLLTQTAFAQTNFQFVEYTVEDGLLDDTAYDVVQDGLGFIWMSHGYHLSRFDGYEFRIYEYVHGDSLMQIDRIGELWDNSDGTLWITNLNFQDSTKRALLKYDRYLDGFIRYTPKLKNQPNGIGYFEQDKEQRVWMGSSEGGGLYEFNPITGESFQHINVHPDSLTQVEVNKITGITDRDSCLYITTYKGLWKFNKSTREFCRPQINAKDTSILFNSFTHKFYSKNWIRSGTDGLWVKVDSTFAIVDEFILPPELLPIMHSWQIDDNDVFIFKATNGFYRYNYKTRGLQLIPEANYSSHGTSSLFTGWKVDRDGNLWVTGDAIRKIVPPELAYYVSPLNGFSEGITSLAMISKSDSSDHAVIVVHNDQGNKIWTGPVKLGSVELKLAYHNEHARYEKWGEPDHVTKFEYNRRRKENSLLWSNGIFLSPNVGKNYLWVAAQRRGIVGIPYSKSTGELSEKNIRFFYPDNRNSNTILGIDVFNVFEDSNEHLWVGSAFSDPTLIDLKQPYGADGSMRTFIPDSFGSGSISPGRMLSVIQKDEKSVWVSTTGGLSVFQNGKFERVFTDSLETYYPYLSPRGRLYISTGTGIYTATASDGYRKFTKLTYAFPWGSLFEDNAERLWMVTDRGLEVLDPRQQITVRIWNKKERQILSMKPTHNGKIFALVASGSLITFDPLEFKISQKKIVPVLTKLIVNHKPVRIRNKTREPNDLSLSTDISALEELVLGHKHNNFSIEFAAMEMRSPNDNLYRYKLEGYDQDWIQTDYKNRRASYSNLPSGSYVFRVKASNHHGVWSDDVKTLKVKILPPPWKTAWAYTGYSIIFVGLLYAARKNIIQRERLKSNLKLAKVEQEKEHFELEKSKEVDRVKTSFFTNISHEFRTPLTLIKGPVQDLLEKYANDPKTQAKLKLVQHNSDLLLKLINQLLDLAKLEAGNLVVEKTEGDVNSFIKAVASSFISLAQQKDIQFNTDVPDDHIIALFDKDKLETILINLINNAIKFTPSHEAITIKSEVNSREVPGKPGSGVTLSLGEGWGEVTRSELILTISDTGIGIPEDQQEEIFERFHQVSEAHKEVGTGIGLALVKELVTLMKGNVMVQSKPGEGSTFRVTLPIEVLEEASVASVNEELIHSPIEAYDLIDRTREGSAIDDNGQLLPHVLVVEDSNDLRAFIINSLGKEFHFLEAEDGKKGLDIATREVPDLIISDVMMPEMDGITMAGKIRHDIRTSHIPLILLTAKSTEDSKLSGLKSGADDYLTKPFNKNELLLKVRNSIAIRAKLREKIRIELMSDVPREEVLSADEQFLDKVKKTILNHLSDEQFSVEVLSEEIGLSRVQLYRKVSALTGFSVNELIRKLRLQKAAQLLEQQWGPVSQVAYEVGFSNLSYFSRTFKEEFGKLPSEYMDKG